MSRIKVVSSTLSRGMLMGRRLIQTSSFSSSSSASRWTDPCGTCSSGRASFSSTAPLWDSTPSSSSSPPSRRLNLPRAPLRPLPSDNKNKNNKKPVPPHIARPPYSETGTVDFVDTVFIHPPDSVQRMRQAAQMARWALQVACRAAQPGVTTDQVDTVTHNALIAAGAYPSPLNYSGFPKSVCSSVNEVICHGIPDARPLQVGDVCSLDVSCFYGGVHGDNCATVVVGDAPENFDWSSAQVLEASLANYSDERDWQGVPHRTDFASEEEEAYFGAARRLTRATREALYAAIATCQPGSCLSDIGGAIQDVADSHGYDTVQKYRGHGICHEFHCAPYVKHFRNQDAFTLRPGMIFTIEPMLVAGSQDCFEWPSDGWTVATLDGSLAAQFEHTVHITEDSVDILTVPPSTPPVEL